MEMLLQTDIQGWEYTVYSYLPQQISVNPFSFHAKIMPNLHLKDESPEGLVHDVRLDYE